MFATSSHRLDFADTRNLGSAGAADGRLPLSRFNRLDASDALDQMAMADAADGALLRLVICATLATLVLALASSLGV